MASEASVVVKDPEESNDSDREMRYKRFQGSTPRSRRLTRAANFDMDKDKKEVHKDILRVAHIL